MSIAKELVTLIKFKLDKSGISQYGAALQGVQAQAQKMGKGLQDSVSQADGLFSGLRGKLLGAFSIGAIGAGIGSIISTNAEFERFETILSTIEGSSDKAKQSMDWISKFAASTPYELAGVTDAFVKLKAYGMDPVKDGLLTTLGDTAAAMGKPIMQAVEAIADAVTGENDRLKDFGIKAAKAGGQIAYSYTDAAGKQQQKIVDASNREQIQATLQAIWNEKYAGAMEKLSGTWGGLVSNLSDQWTRLKQAIGEAGLFDNAKKVLKALVDYLGELDADDLKEIAATITKITKVAALAFSSYAIMRWRAALLAATGATNLLTAAQIRLRAAMAGKGAPLKQMLKFAAILYGIYLIGEDIYTWLQGGESVTAVLIGRVEEWQGWLTQIKTTLITVKDYLGGAGATLGEWLMTGFAIFSVLLVVGTVFMWIVGIISTIVTAIGAVVAVVASPLLLAVLGAVAAVAAMVYYWDKISAAAAAAANTVSEAWGRAMSYIMSMLDGIAAKWESFKGAVSAGLNFIGISSSKVPSTGRGNNINQVNNVTVNGAKDPAKSAVRVASGFSPLARGFAGVR